MLSISDLEPQIDQEFGSRLVPLGFQPVAKRTWVRSGKLPIRELFVITALKGGGYVPIWGISTGCAPSFKSRAFRRQTTDKNAAMDLIMDPCDLPCERPLPTFQFIPEWTTSVPAEEIRTCAEYFVPLALAEFNRVAHLEDFVRLFLDRSRLRYDRFTFYMYVQHQLMRGFVSLWQGNRDEGMRQLTEFCQTMGADISDTILCEYVTRSADLRTSA